MDWQSPLAAGIAVLCGLWMAWQIARPFLTGKPTACAGCAFSGVERAAVREELIQLEPLDDQISAGRSAGPEAG